MKKKQYKRQQQKQLQQQQQQKQQRVNESLPVTVITLNPSHSAATHAT